MTPEELKTVLNAHGKWARGSGGARADLRDADLRGAYLRGAGLQGADMQGAGLRGAGLQGADLRGADMQGANLQYADLRGADMQGVDLRGAYLRGADLRGADLQYANLRGADLRGADLRDADLPPFQIVPEEGEFVGWKKLQGGQIVKLLIPADAKRTSSLVGRKCRAEFVKVLEGSGESGRGGVYVEGEIYRPDKYDDDIRVECTHGVHFFLTRAEAEAWW